MVDTARAPMAGDVGMPGVWRCWLCGAGACATPWTETMDSFYAHYDLEHRVDDSEKSEFDRLTNTEAMRDGFREVGVMLNESVKALVEEGWTEDQAREIVAATFRMMGRPGAGS